VGHTQDVGLWGAQGATTEHTVETLVMQRVAGIAPGCQEINLHHQPRDDAVSVQRARHKLPRRPDRS